MAEANKEQLYKVDFNKEEKEAVAEEKEAVAEEVESECGISRGQDIFFIKGHN